MLLSGSRDGGNRPNINAAGRDAPHHQIERGAPHQWW
jgi:hypothetical protein